jgi:hypothetical protein
MTRNDLDIATGDRQLLREEFAKCPPGPALDRQDLHAKLERVAVLPDDLASPPSR